MAQPKGVADHPAKAEMEALWRQGMRAKGINQYLQDHGYPVVATQTLARYGQRYWTDSVRVELEHDDASSLQAQIEELSELGAVKRVTVRSSVTRSGPTSSTVIEVTPSRSMTLERARPPKIKLSYKVAKFEGKPEGWKVGVKFPDMQIGYWDDGQSQFCTHDEAAIDVAHQIAADVNARYGLDLIVNVGDNLDLPAFGSHRSAPAFMHTTQMAIDRAAEEAAIQRQLAPDADIVWLEGNHESRLTKYLVDRAPALVGLNKGGQTAQPVMSLSNLCRFDEYGIEYLEPYPDAELWVNDHLRFEHGSIARATPGATAAKYLSNGVSVGYGHIHRQELLQATRHTSRGPRTHFAGSAGCLARIDGAVPSAKTGITSRGAQAIKKAEAWQQGIWVFWWQPEGDQLVAVEPVSIWGGWALFRGREYVASCDVEGRPL